MIRTMMVDGHQIVREGLGRLLELEPDMKVVTEASNSDEAIRQVRVVDLDVILRAVRRRWRDGNIYETTSASAIFSGI